MLEPMDHRGLHRKMLRENDPCRKSEVAIRVAEFMSQARQPVMDSPTIPSDEVRKLAAMLIFEEAQETIEALGCKIQFNKDSLFGLEVVLAEPSDLDMEKAVDGCLDTIYVCHWALNAMGVADELPMLEVCDANERKFAEGHWIDDNGKLRKPPDWVGPDISGAIEAQKNWKVS